MREGTYSLSVLIDELLYHRIEVLHYFFFDVILPSSHFMDSFLDIMDLRMTQGDTLGLPGILFVRIGEVGKVGLERLELSFRLFEDNAAQINEIFDSLICFAGEVVTWCRLSVHVRLKNKTSGCRF